MKPAVRNRHKDELLRLRAEALAQGPAPIEPNRQDAVSVGVADEDAQALSEMLQALASQRNRQRDLTLQRIDKALRKIELSPGDYGLCEECEEEIADKRLAAMPWATHCADCQARLDPKRGQARKSITDYK